ncbi:multidrug resistance-associated protein 1 [Tetranychus urticae]|uniref:ABC-type glutathione-S-conjugate transporter n=1 Tax=Tetranychus urticae TaxID=32264 RepID=T1JRR7_TETUR|nr:multidrug resistance-associated protein 1 [Tetranychus urticae]
MVLENYCGYNAWNLNKLWNSETLLFPPCLSDTGLLWIAAGFIWISCPFAIHSVASSSGKKLPWTLLIFTKIIVGLILIVSSAFEFISSLIELRSDEITYPTDYYTPFIKLLTYILAFFLILLYRRKGAHTSGLLFIFWLLMTIYSSINFSTLIASLKYPSVQSWSFDKSDIINKSLQTSATICQLILYCFADTRRQVFTEDVQNECPYASSSFISRLLFFWYDSMALKGFRKTLTQGDMWNLISDNQTQTIEKHFDPHLQSATEYIQYSNYDKPTTSSSQRRSTLKVSILGVLIKAFWPVLLFGAICKLISSLLVFASPQLMDALLTFIVSDEPAWKGYTIAIGMFTAALFQSILDSQYEFWTQTTSMRMRSALLATIYRKSLRLSSLGRRDFTTGEIVNLMAVDTQRIVDYVNIVNFVWSSPVQLVITVYLLWRQLGVSSIAGLAIMLILVPFNGLVTTKFKNCQLRLMKEKDARSKLVSEVLNGMKVLKLYAWEGAFGDIIASIRKNEIDALKMQAIWSAGITFAFACAPFLITVISFATYVLIDKSHVLDANKAFVSISLINILSGPLAFLPIVVTYGANFFISIRRINKYLQGDELDEDAILHEVDPTTPVTIRNASFSWSPDEEETLKDIDMEVSKQKLVAIVGTVGSGKSSLLSALLGDLYKKQGYVNVYGKIAYVPQSAWIQNATVRNNIIFGSPFVKDKYDKVIEACALAPDLQILTGGDQTEIGERGINVSGGQKQRISIARAVYSNSDIYLLDDPLSAVDAHVAKHLFDKVIGPKGLLKNKTRLLVTHRITFLPQVDQIIVMKDGKFRESGTYAELMAKKGEFADFIVQYLAEQGDELDPEAASLIKTLAPEIDAKLSQARSEASSGSLTSSLRQRKGTSMVRRRTSTITSGLTQAGDEVNEKENKFKLIESETAETGSVKLKVYLDYFVAIGVTACIMLIILFGASSAFNLGTNLWLTAWSDDSLNPANNNNTALRNKRLGVYTALGLSETIFTLANTIVMNICIVNGAKWIHEKMLTRLIRAPMSFFDTTPLGRILNRFTKDIDTADTTISFNLRLLVSQLFRTIVSIIVICLETTYLIVVIIVLGVVYILVQKFYISSSRQLRRIESVTRSPIYSHFSETVTGSTSIRAYGASERFTNEMYTRIDINHSSFYPNVGANRWLAIRLELLGNLIVTITALFAVITKGGSSPGTTGLSISYALQITSILNMLVRAVSDVETNIVSIERCLEYTRVPTEAPWVIPSHRPKDNWPKKGQISFKSYSTRYRPGLDLVLKDIVCTIQPNEKVGIVGRTGAGKSSLTLALFRLIEPASGTITIDEEDITQLGLHDLRSRLTVIPQDPVLFSGSFRRNFDPFDMYTDREIWRALEQAHLKSFVDTLDSGLEHEIAEGGENLSVGQRQLVCLTRALLRKTKVLILDEATAAVDVETDELIQETIRKEFKNCTIVTIAHRLNTIMDYDKIIVMDKGQIIEYDSPKNLLADTKTVFYSMAKDAKLV